VDSIAVTYAMMDPVMTVARPVSAFITAFVAGVPRTFSASARTRRPRSRT